MKKRNNDWPRVIIDVFILFAIGALNAIVIAKCSANTTVPDTYEAQATTYEVTTTQTPATIHEQGTEFKAHLYYDIPLDEDLQDYARRVMRYAHAKCYPGSRRKRTQNR